MGQIRDTQKFKFLEARAYIVIRGVPKLRQKLGAFFAKSLASANYFWLLLCYV